MAKVVSRYLKTIQELIEFLKDEEYIYIQPHNFPDHDAVATAFGLQKLLEHFNIKSNLVYEGEIQRDSLKQFIKDLNIDIRNIEKFNMKKTDKIINVDGCKGNKNVTDLIGDEVGVIDHHITRSPDDVEFSDIRVEYGSCSTIITEYYQELGISMSRDVASAFMIGINMDTSMLTRGVNTADLQAYFRCYEVANFDYVNWILRNYIRIQDLDYFKYVIENVEYYKRAAFCHISHGCSQNLLGILADFVLALEEIDFVVLCATNGGKINFSVRNEVDEWDASRVIRQTLEGIGFGGGHNIMAGGVIHDSRNFDKDVICGRVLDILNQ